MRILAFAGLLALVQAEQDGIADASVEEVRLESGARTSRSLRVATLTDGLESPIAALAAQEDDDEDSYSTSCDTPRRFPLRNSRFQSVERDLGAYDPLILSGDECQPDYPEAPFEANLTNGTVLCMRPSVLSSLLSGGEIQAPAAHYTEDPRSIENYFDALAVLYTFFNLLAVLCILFIPLWVLFLAFKCCCSCECCCNPEHSYRKQMCSNACVCTFILFAIAMVVMMYMNNRAMTDGFVAVVQDPPNAAVAIIPNMVEPLQDTLAEVGGTFGSFLNRANTTLVGLVTDAGILEFVGCAQTLIGVALETIRNFALMQENLLTILNSLPDNSSFGYIDSLSESLDNLQATIPGAKADIDNAVDAVNALKDNISFVIQETDAAITEVGAYPGEADNLEAFLDSISRPSQAEADELASTWAAFDAAVNNAGQADTTTERDAFIAAISAVNTAISELPTDQEVDTSFTAFGAATQRVGLSMRALASALGGLQVAMEAGFSFVGIRDTLDAVQGVDDAVYSPQLDDLLETIQNASQASGMLPSVIEEAREAVRGVANAQEYIDCMVENAMKAGDLLSALDPSAAETLEGVTDGLNESFGSGLDQLSLIIDTLDNFNETLDQLPDFEGITQQLESMQAQWSNQSSQIITEDQIDEWEAQLSNVSSVDFSEIDRLDAAADSLLNGAASEGNISIAIEDAQFALNESRVSIDESATLAAVNSYNDNCQAQALLLPPAVCSGTQTALSETVEGVQLAAQTTQTNLQPIRNALADAREQSDTTPLETVKEELQSVRDSFDTEQLTSAGDSLDEVASGLDDIKGQLGFVDEIQAFANERIAIETDLNASTVAIEEFQAVVDGIPQDDMDAALDLLNRVMNLLTAPKEVNGSLAAVIDTLAADNFMTMLQEDGVLSAFEAVLDRLTESCLLLWDENCTTFEGAKDFLSNNSASDVIAAIEDRYPDSYKVEGEAPEGSPSDNGAIWYIMLFVGNTPKRLADFQDEAAPNEKSYLIHGYANNARIVMPYSDERWCYAEECIENTIRFYNEERLPFTPANLPVSRQASFLAMLVPVVLLLVLSICFVGDKVGGTALGCCNLCCAVPFLLITGFAMPMSLFLSDACVSTGSVITTQARHLSPVVCEYYDQETGDCSMEMQNQTLYFNVESIVRSVFVGIPGEGDEDGIQQVWNQVGDWVELVAEESVGSQLDGLATANFSKFILEEVGINETVKELGTVMGSGVRNFGAAVNGEALHSVYNSFEEALCCKTFTPLFLWIFGYLMIAMGMFCCVCPGAFAKATQGPKTRDQLRKEAGYEEHELNAAVYGESARYQVSDYELEMRRDYHVGNGSRSVQSFRQSIPVHVHQSHPVYVQQPVYYR